MIKTLAAAAATALALVSPASAVSPTVASFSCSAGISNCAAMLDSSFPAQGEQWQTGTAWWEGTAPRIELQFDQAYLVTEMRVSLDNNDSYRISWSLDGSTWLPLADIPASAGEIDWGMDTFSSSAGDPDYVPQLDYAPTLMQFVRIAATGGDGLYSMGEIAVTAVVPEPASVVLMLVGVAGLAARRRNH